METYIEYVIIDNLIINYLLLFCSIRTLGLKANKFLLAISSIFGTIFVCVFPLVKIPSAMLVISKIAVGVLMVLISFKFDRLKQFLYCFILFVFYTFLMGGACFAVITLLGGNATNIGMGSYDTLLPVSLVILSCFIYAFIIIRLAKYIYRRKDMMPFMQTAVLTVAGKEIMFKAYLDSGNRLYDKKTNAPVIILSAYSLEKFFSQDEMASLVFGETSSVFKNIHYLSYSTVEGISKKMVVFVADKLSISGLGVNKCFENVCVGVTFKKFNDAITYDMLLHPSLVS